MSIWQDLRRLTGRFMAAEFSLMGLFAAAPKRAADYSIGLEGLLLDYSKNLLDDEARQALLRLAEERRLQEAIEAMFRGDKVNESEGRAALHTALRAVGADSGAKSSKVDKAGKPAAKSGPQRAEVAQTLERMAALVADIHQGERLGYNGKRLTDVVNIGIGGCDLGPAMVTEALRGFHSGHVNCHFVSNVDPVHIQSVLAGLSAEHTLFIIASKSATTAETWQNALAARDWFALHVGAQTGAQTSRGSNQGDNISKHFVLVTGNPAAQRLYGEAGLSLTAENILPVWDWVGGRFSLWSAVGLPIALAMGMENFHALLAGARCMDEHFRTAPFARNMPVILGLLAVWYGLMGCGSMAVVPYAQPLRLLPGYLQQLSMESLGKSVQRSGEPVNMNTGEVVWGVPGSNVQHSCFQLLHQGTRIAPVDFIAVAEPMTATETKQTKEQHATLLANCFSQSQALMQGGSYAGHADSPHGHVSGNKPSNTLLLKTLDPFHLGMLLALYEHKVYVQSVLWDINAFDQWGVELGKRLFKDVHQSLTGGKGSATDPSTAALIAQAKRWHDSA